MRLASSASTIALRESLKAAWKSVDQPSECTSPFLPSGEPRLKHPELPLAGVELHVHAERDRRHPLPVAERQPVDRRAPERNQDVLEDLGQLERVPVEALLRVHA